MRILRTLISILTLSVAITMASAVSGQPAPPVTPPVESSPASGGAQQEYVLGPEDVVEIDVLGTNDKTRARIYTDGTLQTNLVGKVNASGMTTRQLGAELAKSLKAGGFYSDPVVTVEIVGFASRYVTVLGAVGNPSLVPINRPYRLSEILARVGGVRENAADYLIVRPEKGEEKRYFIEKLSSGSGTEDPFVVPGDKIFSPIADVFYISGQVKSPGSYPYKTDLTIAQAIAKAGGVTDSGNDKRVKVKRAGSKQLKLEGDAKVLPGDVLTISERLF